LENTHNFLSPTTNLIGVGAIKDLPTYLMTRKLSKSLIVTDKNIISLGYVQTIEVILKSLFISYDIFDGILHPNCTVSFVEDGLKYFKEGSNLLKRNYDFIISVGGGTNHDCAKAIAIVATNGGLIGDYEGYNKMTKPSLPVIAINTTAGSASEVTNFVVILDESRRLKMVIDDPKILPVISVNDPMFMATMPPEVTASSGIDVVSHDIEAFVSTESSHITDALAINSLKLVFLYLKRVYDNGNDLEAREQMMYASVMAGMAFNNAGLGYVHALSHQIGGYYQQIHGVCNAVLLPHVLEFNSISIPQEKILKLCDAVGGDAHNQNEAITIIKNKIQSLCKDIDIPINLRDIGVEEVDLEFLSKNAVKDICSLTNPRQGTFEDIMNILKAAM